MKKVVEGDVFVIPNSSEKLDSFCEPEWLMEKLRRNAGIYANYSDMMVELWICSSQCDNWADTPGGFQKEAEIKFNEEGKIGLTRNQRVIGYFPKHFPASVVEGKKEGDVIELDNPEYGVKIKLTCRQLNYRYKNIPKKNSRFEDTLNFVL